MSSRWRRLTQLSPRDRALLLEALVLLLRVRAGLHLVRFTTLQRALAPRRTRAPQPVERLAWAVKCVGRHVPRTTCLAEALVIESMLRRYGHAPTLKIGVRTAQPALVAHAWVECDGIVVGGLLDDLDDHAVLS